MDGKLYDQVCSLPVLTDAWKRIKTKRSAGGLDRVSVADFERDFNRNFEALRGDLISRKYVPEPLERIAVPKMDGSGESRPLSLPSVRDKIVQQAVRSVIEPLFNPVFLDSSYAYRPGKGTVKVFKRVNHLLTVEKRRWVVLADFDKFFDTMDQDFAIQQVSRIVRDPDVLRLIRMWVKIGFVNNTGDYLDSDAGVGQGSEISPLLSNIYAHPLDEYMMKKNYAYVRYSDNVIILCHSMKEARTSLEDLKFFVKDMLKLSLNNDPQPIKTLDQGFVFLGIYYQNDSRAISHKKLLNTTAAFFIDN
jgi:group II intron reverse transcriptase/maturase